MAKRRPKSDDDDVHGEMLRHLSENPPSARRQQPQKARPKAKPSQKNSAPAPQRRPRLMLRKLPLELALERLESFLEAKCHQGVAEIIVVVGRGLGSPGGEAVIAPAARRLCQRRGDLVAAVEEAPPQDGGAGALLIRLRANA